MNPTNETAPGDIEGGADEAKKVGLSEEAKPTTKNGESKTAPRHSAFVLKGAVLPLAEIPPLTEQELADTADCLGVSVDDLETLAQAARRGEAELDRAIAELFAAADEDGVPNSRRSGIDQHPAGDEVDDPAAQAARGPNNVIPLRAESRLKDGSNISPDEDPTHNKPDLETGIAEATSRDVAKEIREHAAKKTAPSKGPRPNRSRLKGRKSKGTGAWLPSVVLEHQAVRTLDHAAFRLLVLLALQYRGHSNGAIGLTRAQAAAAGIRSDGSHYRALRELKARGLIKQTYPASRIPPRPAMFALNWLPVDDTEFSRATKTASHAYREWTP